MKFPRASGILLHPTSLPGRFGIGDLGDEAYKFVDMLAASGQTYWQILPLSPTGYGNSPYSSVSAFAGNPLLISPDLLVADGLVASERLAQPPQFETERVDHESVGTWKAAMLDEAFESFRSAAPFILKGEFEVFRHENAWWLDDYCVFRTLRDAHGHQPWYRWAEPIRLRNRDAIAAAVSQLGREIEAERFRQFLFFRQWQNLKHYANKNGISIIGDIPIFVALDSADVWCNQSNFKLDADGAPKVVAGVPPDYFSKTGQRWGNPIYDWQTMQRDDFGWWTARTAFAFQTADVVRLDHFIGFIQNWEIPAADKTAENGSWVKVPGAELFATLRRRLGDLPLIAEDLGSVTPEVETLRDDFGFPGMRILQYGFGGDANNRDLPHNYSQNSVVYTGTHDNDTLVGWYRSAPRDVKAHCRKYLHISGREINWEMIRAAFASVAETAIIPAQDILGLGSNARMNTPATSSGNWQWRLKDGDIDDRVTEKLRDLTKTYGRANTSAKETPPERQPSDLVDLEQEIA